MSEENIEYVASFLVPGEPKTKGSMKPISIRRGGRYTGKVAMLPSDPKSKTWEKTVKEAAVEAMKSFGAAVIQFPEPVGVELKFIFVRPKSHYRKFKGREILKDSAPIYPIQNRRNDLDKLIRNVYDGLTGVVFTDDCQVVSSEECKVYGGECGVIVKVYRILR